MHNKIDNIKDRWLSASGAHFINVVLNRQVTPEEYQEACLQFFKKKVSFMQSETYRGLGEFEDLRGMDLSGKDLRGLVFAKSELSFSNFEGSLLEGVSFSGAKLYLSSFKNIAAQKRIEFFECYAQGADFQNVRLVDANFCNADLINANFTNAVLEHCDFGGARLQNSILDGARMIDCDVGGLHLSERHRDDEWFKISTLINQEHIIWEA